MKLASSCWLGINIIDRKKRIAQEVADVVTTRTVTVTHNPSRCMAVSRLAAMPLRHKQLLPLEVMVLTLMPPMVATRTMSPCGMLLWPNSSNKARAKVSLDRQGHHELSA